MSEGWEGKSRKLSSDGIRHKIVTETANRIGNSEDNVRQAARSARASDTEKLSVLYRIGSIYLEKRRRLQARRSGSEREPRSPTVPLILKLKLSQVDLRGVSERLDGFSELSQIEMWASGIQERKPQERPKRKTPPPVALID